METREPLKCNMRLRFQNHDKGSMIYTVHDEIGRGRLCIAYEASYINNVGISKKVFIKECYPFKLRIFRDENGRLIPDESDSENF